MLVQKTERRTMEELAKQLGITTVYATATYVFFHWLDENASDEAKAALARTMSFKDYKNEQLASALVEVFDRIYTYPLLRWRAFERSLLFTTVVTAIFVFEVSREPFSKSFNVTPLLITFLFNAFSDYLSLSVIRPLLIRSGTKPVVGLVLGAVSALAIVLGVHILRSEAILILDVGFSNALKVTISPAVIGVMFFALAYIFLVWPALAVFVWLPLFALGILIARLLTPLSWIVGRTQWFLKEGKEHPLKAIGYVAAVVVFLGTVAGRAVFGA
jgi:hypothetical protein